MELLRDYFAFTEALRALGTTGFFTWIGIALCLTQSAMFSRLNLATREGIGKWRAAGS